MHVIGIGRVIRNNSRSQHPAGLTPLPKPSLSSQLIPSGTETLLLLRLAIAYCECSVPHVGGVGTEVLLYVAAALDRGSLVDEGVPVDREGPRRVTRVGDGRGRYAAQCAATLRVVSLIIAGLYSNCRITVWIPLSKLATPVLTILAAPTALSVLSILTVLAVLSVLTILTILAVLAVLAVLASLSVLTVLASLTVLTILTGLSVLTVLTSLSVLAVLTTLVVLPVVAADYSS